MAGIGFELRRHLRKETYGGILRAYLLAGVVGSGPWVISISSMLLIGLLAPTLGTKSDVVTPFLATVTYLMAGSLTISGLLQLLFVRFVADRLFEKKSEAVAPNTIGAVIVTTLASGVFGALVSSLAFAGCTLAFRAALTSTFVALSNVWILSVLLSGVKAYRNVIAVFFVGYALTVSIALGMSRFGIEGYLVGFFVGHAFMLFAMLVLVLRSYPSTRFVAFEFFDREQVFPELVATGVLLNGAVWLDHDSPGFQCKRKSYKNSYVSFSLNSSAASLRGCEPLRFPFRPKAHSVKLRAASRESHESRARPCFTKSPFAHARRLSTSARSSAKRMSAG